MRFAFVLPNLSGGGAEKAVVKTALALVQRNHQAGLFLLSNRNSYDVSPLINIYLIANKLQRSWLGKRFLAFRLRRSLLHFQPDIVISTLPFADEVTSLTNSPNHWCRIANTLSAEIKNIEAISVYKASRRFRKYKKIYGKKPLIAVSNGVAADLRGYFGVTSRIETVFNPFDFDFIREACRDPQFIPPSYEYVIHVARFSPQKRHDILLDAWTKIPCGPRLLLLTESSPSLEAMINSRGLTDRVQIIGFQSNPYSWMANAKLLVLCSDYEGLPNVLIESLICGTPVISTDCPSGPSQILADVLPQSLVACGNSDELAARIRSFLLRSPSIENIDLSAYASECTAEAYEKIATDII